MDSIKVTKAPVVLLRLGKSSKGMLHLTTHHMIFREDDTGREIWICYPIIADVERRQYNPLMGHSSIRIRGRDFTFVAFNISSESLSSDIFESIMKLTCVSNIEKLYAYMYKPGTLEKQYQSWNLFDPLKEFARMGTDDKWRVTTLNKNYQFCPSYPRIIMVPESISDNVMNYAVKFRSKGRVPALSYFHKVNKCTITRCSQPMVGLKQSRSRQDEKLVEAIFATTQAASAPAAATGDTVNGAPEMIYGATQNNLIVDARPTANAMGQTALGAGTENMENYRHATKIYLGIDNIHVMRDSLGKVIDALKNGDLSMLPPSQELLHKSGWLKHLSTVLKGAIIVAKQVHYYFSHVVIHCSDGWDRTSQLSSLAQIFLDPYFRTLDGFMILVEKEWLSFGHKFAERSGFLSNEKHFVQVTENNNAQQVFSSVANKLVKQSHIKYTSPVFHQFLDCVYQLVRQNPDMFEYNERFLRRLLYHLYSCQYGTFLYNSEKERVNSGVAMKTRSVWDYFRARRKEFINPSYRAPSAKEKEKEKDIMNDIFLPDPNDIRWWSELYGRTEEEMNLPGGKIGFSSELGLDSAVDAGRKSPSPYNSHHHHHHHHSKKHLNPSGAGNSELRHKIFGHSKKLSSSHHSIGADGYGYGSDSSGSTPTTPVTMNEKETPGSSDCNSSSLEEKASALTLDHKDNDTDDVDPLDDEDGDDPLGAAHMFSVEPLGNAAINYDKKPVAEKDDHTVASPTRKVSQMELEIDGDSKGQSQNFLGRLSRSLK